MKPTLKELKQQGEGLTHISEWLKRIGEKDSACIAEVMAQVKADPEAMKYFVKRAAE